MFTRPALTRDLSADAFLDHYWLKSELVAFCRDEGLSGGGGKEQVANRIAEYLRSGRRIATEPARGKSAAMPAAFHPDMVIGPGWRCTAALRAFLAGHLGTSFRFDSILREHILRRPGTTLREAMDAWRAGQADKAPSEIGAQFEYNRFMRDHARTHPAASRAERIAAWHSHRNTPKSARGQA